MKRRTEYYRRSPCVGTLAWALGFTCVFITAHPVVAGSRTFTEDFTTTVYMDPASTTAAWDTLAGELKLPPFVISLAGSCDTPDVALGVTVAGDHAYVADFSSGLQVIDIGDPAGPTPVGSCDTPGEARAVTVAGDHAFVADGQHGLQVIDISDPTGPTLVGSCDTPGLAYGVTVAGDHAFVADFSAGLQVIDISDPTGPTSAGSCDTPDAALGVAVAGDHAFVADRFSGLQVIDISDPMDPTFAGSCYTLGEATAVTVAGDHAFVADYIGGLQVIDISDPVSPMLVGSYFTPDIALGVAVAGDRAYVADGLSGLQIIDISDPTGPIFVRSCETPDAALGVAVAGDHAFVADFSVGLQVIDISDPTGPTSTGSCDTPDAALGVAVAGDHAFVADRISGLQVIEIRDPTGPILVGTCDTPGQAGAVEVAGDHAYVADAASDLQVIDISDPTGPAIVGSCDMPGTANGMAVAGDRAFVTDRVSPSLHVFDVRDPTNPTLVVSFGTPDEANGVAVAGDHACVAGGFSGLYVIDIGDPTDPLLAGSCDTPGYARGVAVAGDHAYVADGQHGLQVIDISDPTNPTLVGSCDTSDSAFGVTVAGDHAFVATYYSGLQMIDISDPESPTLAGPCDTPGIAAAVTVAGQHAYVADHTSGLQVLQVRQDAVAFETGAGQSLDVDGETQLIPRVRLSTSQTAGVSWAVSTDAGQTWTSITPDGIWTRVTDPGSNLRWRSTHAWSPGLNPTVSELTLDWLNEHGFIVSIVDVPNDQGGQVSLTWSRSGYDFVNDPNPIHDYAIYRRIDPALARKLPPVNHSQLHPEVARRAAELRDAGWHYVATVPARCEEGYAIVVPTLADSTDDGGVHYSVFMVSAMTDTPGVFYDSPPDSGYSVDNLAPTVPTGLFYVGDLLSWNDPVDSDFDYFTVYGSNVDGLTPEATLIDHTIETTLVVPAGSYPYLLVTATDFAGNEGDAAVAQCVTAVNEAPPAFRLLGAFPNPFNPRTTIRFDLPVPCAVNLTIYDTSGRLVKNLVRGANLTAGRHEVTWTGSDPSGRDVPSGVYLFRLEAGGKVMHGRMSLVR